MYTFYEYTNTKNKYHSVLLCAYNRNASSFCKALVSKVNRDEFGWLGGHMIDVRTNPEKPMSDVQRDGVPAINYAECQFFDYTNPPKYAGRNDSLMPMHVKQDMSHNYVQIYRNPLHRYISGIKQWGSISNIFIDEFGDAAARDVLHVLAKYNSTIAKHVKRIDNADIPDANLHLAEYHHLFTSILLDAEYKQYFNHNVDMLKMVDFVFQGGHFLTLNDSHTTPIACQQAILPFVYPDMQFVEMEDLNPYMEEILDITLSKTEMHNSRAELKGADRNQPSKNHNRDFKVFANALPEYFRKRREGETETQFDKFIDPELACYEGLRSYASTSNKKAGLEHLEEVLTKELRNPVFYTRNPQTLAFHSYAVKILPDIRFKKTLMDAIRNFWNNQEREQAFDWLY